MKNKNKNNQSLITKEFASRESVYSIAFIFACILMVHFIIHSFTGMWWLYENPYNSYVLQAQRWLGGHLDLGQTYPHLEIAEFGGKYFISFPPFPSFVMLPFVIFFGTNTPDGLIALASALIGAAYIYKLFEHFGYDNKASVMWTLFTYICSNMLFITTNAWVWFIAQNMCFTLSATAVYYSVKGRGGAALALWAFSVGCRPINAMYIVLISYILISGRRKEGKPVLCRETLLWMIMPLITAITFMVLNYARFGSPIEFGHNYLLEFREAEHGQFSIRYIAENLPLLFKLPEANEGVFEYPSFNGMMFFLVTPMFFVHGVRVVRAVFTRQKTDAVMLWGIPVLICIHFLMLTAHRTMGGYHFGNRYTLDALPIAVLATAYLGKDGNSKYDYWYTPVMLMALCMNMVGTVAVYNSWI